MFKVGRGSSEDLWENELENNNILYDKIYGLMDRYVPPHVPFLIDRHIMIDLSRKFGHFIEETSSHKFRKRQDGSFGFSYFNFITGEMKHPLFKYMTELDMNSDDRLDAGKIDSYFPVIILTLI